MLHSRHERLASVFSLLLLAVSIGCASTSAPVIVDGFPPYWPTESWLYSTPEMQGVNPGRLTAMMADIASNGLAIDSVVIVRHGYIIWEEYPSSYTSNSLHILHSVSKSVTSILFGIAMQQGYITDLSQRVVDFFPDFTIANMDERKEGMTLWHLLTMSTGFEWDEWSAPYDDPVNNNHAALLASLDAVQYVLDRPMAYEPGEVWVYCGGATTLLGEIIERATGTEFNNFAVENLFAPLGIDAFLWGNVPGGYANTAGGLFLRPQDMARLGLLMLCEGAWAGETLLSASYVAEAIDDYYHPYDGVTYGYGYQFWSFPAHGIFFAWGAYDQKIYFVPELDLVVVFTASLPDEQVGAVDYLMNEYILPAMDEIVFNPITLLLPVLVILAVAVPIGIVSVYWLRRRRSM